MVERGDIFGQVLWDLMALFDNNCKFENILVVPKIDLLIKIYVSCFYNKQIIR